MKGNDSIIKILNDLLAGELTAIDQYLVHGEVYADMGFNELAEKSLHESDHEREHARAIIQRILFLEGVPDMAKRHALNVGQDVPGMLQSDLNLEYGVAKALKAAIDACEKANDYVSRDMLKKQLDDTEMDHAYYLEIQLGLIEKIGLSNYLQKKMGSGSPA